MLGRRCPGLAAVELPPAWTVLRRCWVAHWNHAPRAPVWVVRRTYDPASPYGRRMVGEYPAPDHAALEVLGGSTNAGGSVSESGAVCYDLETTGLSGGAGTVAFLVGFGWFDRGAFHTCQYLLGSLAAERRMLEATAAILQRAETLLTFNGKSFDAPMTEARFSLHRLRSPLETLSHVDLLHPARRLWHTDDARLIGLEQAVLGVRRVGDVPGAEIPNRYVAFLRGGDARLLVG